MRAHLKRAAVIFLEWAGLGGCLPYARALMDPASRDVLRDYRGFSKRMREAGEIRPAPVADRGTVLFIGLHESVPTVKLEGFLSVALRAKGLRPAVLLSRRNTWVEKYYELFGIHEFHYLDDHLYAGRQADARLHREVESFFARRPGFEAVLGYAPEDVEIGKHAMSLLVRSLHAGPFDPSSSETVSSLKRIFLLGLRASAAAERALGEISPVMTIFNERGYTPYGEFFDASLKRGIDTIQFVGAHTDRALHFKRYGLLTRTAHPVSLSAETWARIKEMDLPEEEQERFLAAHHDFYKTGSWFSRQKVQTGKAILPRKEMQARLGLDPSKKTAVIFSHVLWDATFFYGEGLFRDYAEWFVASVKAACANDRVNWVVKLHPTNVWRLRLDGHKGELVEYGLIRSQVGSLPPHVKLVAPESGVNTFSLFQAMDYGVTVRGTVGMEMPLFGVPVFTAGTGRYSGLGFTVDSRSKEEYLDKLARIHEFPAMSGEQISLAKKYAYALFNLCPLSFDSFRISYPEGDGTPRALSPLVEPGPGWGTAELSDDLRAFGEWAVDRDRTEFIREPSFPGAETAR